MTAKEWEAKMRGTNREDGCHMECIDMLRDLAECEAAVRSHGYKRDIALERAEKAEERAWDAEGVIASIADCVNTEARECGSPQAESPTLDRIRNAVKLIVDTLRADKMKAGATLAASERSDAIHLDALAESERLRVEQEAECYDLRRKLEEATELLEWTEDDDWWC